MDAPSPYPRRGRPRIEDEPEETVPVSTLLPVPFKVWFEEAARASGMSAENARREAMLEWGRKHHPKSTEPADPDAGKPPED